MDRLLAKEEPFAGDEVKAYFAAKYGEWILLRPRARGWNLIVYVLPVAALVAGTAVVVRLTRRWALPGAVGRLVLQLEALGLVEVVLDRRHLPGAADRVARLDRDLRPVVGRAARVGHELQAGLDRTIRDEDSQADVLPFIRRSMSGFTGEVTVRCAAGSSLPSWRVAWTFGAGQQVGQAWNASCAQTGTAVDRTRGSAARLGALEYGHSVFEPFRGWVNQQAAEGKATFERMFFPQYAPVSAAEAPTASTYGSYAGLLSFGCSVPLFPPDTTTTMPARQAFSTAWVSGSSR